MPSHEQSIADKFNEFLRRAGKQRGVAIHDFSLGGQDRDAGADYLLSDASRFALVEFKFDETNIHHEVRKRRRLALCQLLPQRLDMQERHDQCHFIAWRDEETQGVNLNIYRKEVCNCSVLGHAAQIADLDPETALRVTAGKFAQEFLDPKGYPRSLNLLEFEAYLEWLMQDASGAAASTLELLTNDPSRPDELVLITLQSVREAYRWMQTHKMRNRPRNDPDSSPKPFRPF